MSQLWIAGDPIAQPRHRATSIGGFARMYLPAKHPVRAWKQEIALRGRSQWRCHEGPVDVSLTFYLPRPKAAWRKTKPNEVAPHVAKPDVDNLAKAVCDALNGIAWADDGQVCRLRIEKFVCGDEQREPGVMIEIEEVKPAEGE